MNVGNSNQYSSQTATDHMNQESILKNQSAMKYMISFFNKSMCLLLAQCCWYQANIENNDDKIFCLRRFIKFPQSSELVYSVTMKRYHGLSGMKNRNLFFHSCGGQTCKIKMQARLVCCETSLPDLQTATFSLYLLMAFPLCSQGKKKKMP